MQYHRAHPLPLPPPPPAAAGINSSGAGTHAEEDGEEAMDHRSAAADSEVRKWRHSPDATSFDDGAAFRAIRRAVLGGTHDPDGLRLTALEIAALLPDCADDYSLASLWDLLISLARQTPAGHVAQLDLVVILDHLSASPKTTAMVNVDGFEQLNRLDGLNQAIGRNMVSPSVTEQHIPTLTRWINLNAFAAMLWSYNLIDGRDFAMQQLRAAFEEPRRRSSSSISSSSSSSATATLDYHHHHHPGPGSAENNFGPAADASVMAAAQWAIHSCQRLYHLCVTSDATSPAAPPAAETPAAAGKSGDKRWAPGARFKGRGGFSFARWEFWQEAFEEAHLMGSGAIETKVEAQAAATLMENVMYAGLVNV